MDELDVLTVAFLQAHPRAAARELERMPAAQTHAVLARAPVRVVAPVLADMHSMAAAAALSALDDERAALVLSTLPGAAAARVLRHVVPPRRAALLDAMTTTAALTCRALLRYPQDTVGAVTQVDALALDESATVREALEALRGHASSADSGVFVVTRARQLRGWVGAAALLQGAPALPLSALAQPVPGVPALMPVTTAVDHPAFAAALLVAVVEQGDRLLGAVTLSALRGAVATGTASGPAVDDASVTTLLAAGYWNAVSELSRATVSALMPRPRPPR